MFKIPEILPVKAIMTVLITIIVVLSGALYIVYSGARDASVEVGKSAAVADQCIGVSQQQNAGIQAVKEEGEKQQRKVTSAYAAATTVRAASDARAMAMLAVPPLVACDKAISWGISEAQVLRRDWQ